MPANKTMRITGGSLVRRRFLIPELVDENVVRPTPDRVREAVFSMIKDELKDAEVLDLFAGSGAHGFESISRGAKRVTFIEKNPRIAAVIKENIAHLDLSSQCNLLLTDALAYVAQVPTVIANVIFVDPPYSLVLQASFFDQLSAHLALEGLIIFRCFKKEAIDIGHCYAIERDRVYGGTRVLILKRATPSII